MNHVFAKENYILSRRSEFIRKLDYIIDSSPFELSLIPDDSNIAFELASLERHYADVCTQERVRDQLEDIWARQAGSATE